MKPDYQEKRTRLMARVGLAAVAALLVAAPWPARSHHLILENNDSVFPDKAMPIPTPEISWAVYNRLESASDVDAISFEMAKPGPVHLGIFVPARPEFDDFYPTYALVGPGLPAPLKPLPVDLPPGMGAVVVTSEPQARREVFYEPFTATRLYRGVTSLDMEVEPGTYYMVVWHPAGEAGDYLISYGKAEKWSFRDLVDAYKIVVKVKGGAWGKFRESPKP